MLMTKEERQSPEILNGSRRARIAAGAGVISYGFPVITKMVKERKAFIDESLRKAQESNEKLANIQAESESILQQTREQQAKILKEANATRNAIVEQAQTKAKEEGARILNEAKAAIETEKQNAIREIRGQVATLSIQIAKKVLRQNLGDEQKQMELIDRMLDEVTANK